MRIASDDAVSAEPNDRFWPVVVVGRPGLAHRRFRCARGLGVESIVM